MASTLLAHWVPTISKLGLKIGFLFSPKSLVKSPRNCLFSQRSKNSLNWYFRLDSLKLAGETHRCFVLDVIREKLFLFFSNNKMYGNK